MSSPSCKIVVTTPTIAKGRRIVLSSPLQESEESDSDGPWTGFEDIVGVGTSGRANSAGVDPRVQEVSSEVEGVPFGELSFVSSAISSNAIEFQQWFVLHVNVGRRPRLRWLETGPQ